jgi:hypothetical protein
MFAEFDIYGVYLPALLVLMLLALIASLIVRRGLAWIGFYSIVWHRGLFDLALYVVLLGGITAFSQWLSS